MSDREEDLRKSLKHLYDDLLDAENKQEKDPSGFKNRIKVIHETLQDQEMKICGLLGLGDFGTLRDFDYEYLSRGDSGMDQIIKTQIKLLAVEIGLDLEKDSPTENSNDNSVEAVSKHKWTRNEKIGIGSLIVAILAIVIGILI